MTKTAYTPKPGSVADRAIAHLQSQPPAGAEVSTSALAEAVGATGESIRMCLQPALDAGAVFARPRGGHARSPLFWSLADHAARDARTGEASSPANGSQTPEGDGPRSSTAPAKAGRMQPAAAGHAGMRIALWSDGTLQIQRAATDLVVFSADETRALVRYLDHIVIPEEAASS